MFAIELGLEFQTLVEPWECVSETLGLTIPMYGGLSLYLPPQDPFITVTTARTPLRHRWTDVLPEVAAAM